MAMTKIQKKALDFTLEELADDLDVIPAIIHLKSKEVFTDNDGDFINSKSTQQEKVSEFIKLLKRKGSTAFDIFHCYLKNCTGSSHLADELTGNLQTATEKVMKIPSTDMVAGMGNMAYWKTLEEKFYNIPCKYQTPESYQNIPSNLNILLIGKTGSGKSSTGNTLLGSPEFKEKGTSRSETKTITMKRVTEGNKVITVIDTPGLFDTDADFTNEELILEIVKTVKDFRQGIHLFLLVCGPNIKYTKEEEETITIIEKILTKNVYKTCVLVLSRGYCQFGMKQDTVKSYIADEKYAGGKFSNIIDHINDRVVAVENCFPNEFLKFQHRQKFLCVLMQVISDNNGSYYSSKLFQIINKRVEREEKERKSRIQRKEELAKMRNDLGKFLLDKYLLSLSVHDLLEDQILTTLERNIDDMMVTSMIKQLDYVNKEDVKIFLKQFVLGKKEMIENILALKLQEETQKVEIKRKNMEIKQKEDQFKMRSFVLGKVTTYLRSFSRPELENIKKYKQFPSDKIDEILKQLKEQEILIDEEEVQRFVKETFFESSGDMERFINEKLLEECLAEQSNKIKRLQLDFSNQRIREKLSKEFPNLIETSSEAEINTLKCCLEKNDMTDSRTTISNYAKKMSENLQGDYQMKDTELTSFIESYILDNTEFMEKLMTTSLKMRITKRKIEEQKTLESVQLQALKKISDMIKSELDEFVRGKDSNQLKAIKAEIRKDKVPLEILTTVRNKLKERHLDVLDQNEMQVEILKQLKAQNDTIDVAKKETKECFAGCNLVFTKRKRPINISEIVVGDEVLAIDSYGTLFYDKIYLFSHANRNKDVVYIKISTACGKVLFISPNHLLPINGLHNHVPAKVVNVGDTLFSVNNKLIIQDEVTSVSYQKCKGAFCPMTMNGTIVVSGVVASCFTTFINPSLAHLLLLPFRVMFNCLPTSVFQTVLPYEGKEGMPVVLAKCRSAVMLTLFFADYCKEKLASLDL